MTIDEIKTTLSNNDGIFCNVFKSYDSSHPYDEGRLKVNTNESAFRIGYNWYKVSQANSVIVVSQNVLMNIYLL